jgi:DNA-damage-inducible protein D
MDKEKVADLFKRFEEACFLMNDVECWRARELQEILGYKEWRNFLNTIDKAIEACKNSGINELDHFVDITIMVSLGSGSQREIEDIALTRYACYLIAQNGDPSKSEIAFAQTYFAVQTRKQEIIEKRLLDIDRVVARVKLSKTEKKLSGIIYERGVDDQGFAIIRSKGDEALFGGHNTSSMKRKLNLPDNRPLADFLPTITIKAKDLATELTSHNVVDKDLHGTQSITIEHVDNNRAVRKMLIDRGVTPEALPPDEDVKKTERRLTHENAALEKEVQKQPKLAKRKTEE